MKKPKGIAGLTTDPWRRKGEWVHRYPNMTNWREEGPFRGKNAAVKWEKEQEALGYQTSNGGDDPGNPHATRYGYQFNY